MKYCWSYVYCSTVGAMRIAVLLELCVLQYCSMVKERSMPATLHNADVLISVKNCDISTVYTVQYSLEQQCTTVYLVYFS